MQKQEVSRTKKVAQEKQKSGLKVKTRVRTGRILFNRCESKVRREKPKTPGVKVKTGVKAGGISTSPSDIMITL